MPRKGRRTVSDLSLSSCARRCLRIRGWGWSFLNEKRDAWRKTFFDELKDIAADCKTKGEVAIKLNKAVFERFNVKYSKARPKADQSPYETIKASMASCTGLSVLLVDACRAVGVPARVMRSRKKQ